jgi:hypothetical protein
MATFENKLSPDESLSLITNVILKTKEKISHNSFPLLLWGWLIAIASFSFFLIQNFTASRFYFIPFPVLAITGIVITYRWYAKQKTISGTETYLNYFINRMWLVLGLCFITVVFINVSHGLVPFTYTLILAAVGTLASGLTIHFRPLIVGGVLFLCAAVISSYVPDSYKALIHGFAIIGGYIIPGYLLKNHGVNGREI